MLLLPSLVSSSRPKKGKKVTVLTTTTDSEEKEPKRKKKNPLRKFPKTPSGSAKPASWLKWVERCEAVALYNNRIVDEKAALEKFKAQAKDMVAAYKSGKSRPKQKR